MDLWSYRSVKEFSKTESRRRQRFIKTTLKGERMVDGYAKEHNALRQGWE
jgi:hypothetical protein